MISHGERSPHLSLLFPLGVLIASEESRVWVRVREVSEHAEVSWRWESGATQPTLDHSNQVLASFADPGRDIELGITAPQTAGPFTLVLTVTEQADANNEILTIPVTVLAKSDVPSHLLTSVRPFSYAWGVDRGLPVHRMHLEQFLEAHAADIRGHCLEFQEPRYVPRFGGANVQKLDILHVDDSNDRATLVADLTQKNALPENRFDCIICTHVLQSIFDLKEAVSELHRALAPGGILLVAEPQISTCDARYGELWRFTRDGLRRLLETVFAATMITIDAYGNSLTAAGEVRGLVSAEFTEEALGVHDYRFAAEICARAIKV